MELSYKEMYIIQKAISTETVNLREALTLASSTRTKNVIESNLKELETVYHRLDVSLNSILNNR